MKIHEVELLYQRYKMLVHLIEDYRKACASVRANMDKVQLTSLILNCPDERVTVNGFDAFPVNPKLILGFLEDTLERMQKEQQRIIKLFEDMNIVLEN